MKRELVSDIDRLRLAIDNWGLALVNEMQLLREAIVTINIERKNEPITHDDYIETENDHLEARCLNCHNAKACKENNWQGCKFEPIEDEPQIDGAIDEARFKAHCMNCQRDVADIKCLDCDGDKYFIADEPQTDCSWK